MPRIPLEDDLPPELREAAKRATPEAKGPWYKIEAKAEDKKRARVDLFDSIGGWFGVEAKDFIKELNDLEVETIELHLNSPGGNVFDGIAIYNALVDHDADVEVTVDGLAASAASFIAMAGDEITVNRASEIMIHDASAICWGNAADMEAAATRLNRFSDNIASIYADQAGGTTEEWRDLMKAETWYSGQEAVDAGLATKMVKLKKAAKEEAEEEKNRFDLSIFNHAGRSHAPAPFIATTTNKSRASVRHKQGQEKPSMTPKQLETLGLPEDATDDEINARLAELVENEADTESEDDEPDDGDDEEDEPEAKPKKGESQEDDEDDTDDGPTNGPRTVSVDEAVWNQMQQDMQSLKAGEARRSEEDRSKRRSDLISNALAAGKILPSERKEYENAFDANEQTTTALIDKLQAKVPMKEIGRGDGDSETVDDAYDDSMLTPAERRARDEFYGKQGA